MAILLHSDTKVIVQGITGKEGMFWAERMLENNTNVVAGVTPGKEGQTALGLPVYNTVSAAAHKHGAEASVVFVPPRLTKDAAFEALDAGLKLVVLLADGVPVQDCMEIRTFAKEKNAVVLGPNTAGMATPGQGMLGFVPVWLEDVYKPGKIGFITKSGSLTNEVASHVVAAGFGISSSVGLGGDPVPCTRTVEVLRMFEADPDTEGVVIVGEIGGSMEEEAAELMQSGGFTKPLVAYIAGCSAPPGKSMGHAGAIVTMGKGTYEGKAKAITEAGGLVAKRPSEAGELLKKKFFEHYGREN
ncbi:succinate--CoA ligase subunit alpha [Desulfitibacter alkalitolerans]|uniref:succinate--CoA ligase subunit alpha n=1 Tax=Desulfitibacter alkalitolerans TaxID=264641 RepID=UPI00048261E9|nr:succinate--CoA ligase subunit alpha [Desulfitibacter alkalitolerans]